MSYSKPESYREAQCCRNCIHVEDTSDLEWTQFRCRLGLELGDIAMNDRIVLPEYVCDEFKGEQ